MQADIQKDLRHNFKVNVLDGAFFGSGLGFSSSVAVIPLFVATLTESTTIAGLLASSLMIGWHVPQLFTADYVARLCRFKGMVMVMTLHERWPFLGLAVVALAQPVLGNTLTLLLTCLLIGLHALGAGLTATPWQSMISKIIPPARRGTFYGIQSGAASLMNTLSVVAAGKILATLPTPYNFALCFFLAGVAMMISLGFLARVREPEGEPACKTAPNWGLFFQRLREILRDDLNFRWFLVARMLSQFALMAVAFYTLYSVQRFGVGPEIAGIMAGLLTLAQMVASPIVGWLGDHIGHRRVFMAGVLFAGMSALIVVTATALPWLYVAFALTGASNAVMWTSVMSMTADFGKIEDRPYYIGMCNTLIAPVVVLAPIAGGLLKDVTGTFEATFLLATAAAVVTALVVMFGVRDTHKAGHAAPASAVSVGAGMD